MRQTPTGPFPASSTLGPAERQAALDAAQVDELDVVVVGGGVVGAGAALDAVTRGLTVAWSRRATGRRHVQPVQQADPRRPALPGDARLRAGPRGAAGARPAADPARAAPGPAGAVPLPARRTAAGSGPTSAPGVALYDAMAMAGGHGRGRARATGT